MGSCSLSLKTLLTVPYVQRLLSFSACCPTVSVTTTGSSNSTQFVRLGTYHALAATDPTSEESYHAGRPVYVHALRREYLFYVPGRARGLWMVGPRVGRFSGGLANRGDDLCVDRVDRPWKFADVGGWVTDPELTVKCVNETVGEFSMHPQATRLGTIWASFGLNSL